MVIEKKLTDIKPYDKNAKIHTPDQVQKVANSIKEFGMLQPIVVDTNNEIVIGHCRFEALKKLGHETAPTILAENLSQDKIKALRIIDNKLNESDWNFELLEFEMQDIQFDFEPFGFEIEKGIDDLIEDTPPAVEEVPPISKYGQIWKLGRHRLACIDSTNSDMVKKLMDAREADLVLTDPPYNVNYEGTAGKIQNDNMDNNSFLNFLTDAFISMDETLKPGGAFYIWHADSEGYNFRKAASNANWQVRQVLIWNKNSLVLGRQDYHWKHEPCLYGWKEGAAHYFIDDRTQTTVFEDAGIDFKKLKKEEAIQMLKDIFADRKSTSVINEDKPARNAEHPTMKPINYLLD